MPSHQQTDPDGREESTMYLGHLDDGPSTEKRRDRRRRSRSRSPAPSRHGGFGPDGDAPRHRIYRQRDRERSPYRRHRRSHPPSRAPAEGSTQTRSRPPAASRHGPPSPPTTTDRKPRRRHRSRSPSPSPSPPPRLPYGARALSRWDFAAFEPLFAHYLDIQKGLALAGLSAHETHGRWKSFVRKWNGAGLAEGWYEPEMFLRVVRKRAAALAGEAVARREEGAGAAAGGGVGLGIVTPPMSGRSLLSMVEDDNRAVPRHQDSDDDGDEWGPTLPPERARERAAPLAQGPGIPSLEDLEVRAEMDAEARQAQAQDLRVARRADRALQRERLEELAPRAEPGSRERMLEKRREAGDRMRSFREGSPGGAGGDVEMGEVMGEGEDGVGDYRRMLADLQRRKTEREVRREEAQRARNEERDERIREYRAREEGTVDMLRELARQRFG